MDAIFFFKGLVIGFVIAAPVGPIGVLCARRTLMHGRRAGFFSGMGAATADAIYGFIAAFGLTIVSEFVEGHQVWLKLLGGAVLCTMGLRALLAHPDEHQDLPPAKLRYAGMYTSTLFLTLTNPMTIFSFAAVFASFGLAGTKGSIWSAGVLVVGVLLGSALWWLFLVGIFSIYRRRFQAHELLWLNRISGSIIAVFGAVAIVSGLR